MGLSLISGSVIAAVNAATTQVAQAAALIAPWAGGNVTIQVMAGTTLLSTLVHGPWVLNTGVTPRQLTLGARVSRVFSANGTPNRVVFRVGTTDVFEIDAGVQSGSVSFQTTIAEMRREKVSGIIIRASLLLPAGTAAPAPPPPAPSPAPSLVLSYDGSAVVGVQEPITVTAANIVAPVTVTVARVSGVAGSVPSPTVTPEPGTLTRLAYALASAVGVMRLQASATIGGSLVTSNFLDIDAVAAPPPAPGATITSLQVVSTTAGTYPYSATVLPLRGQVPAGSNLQSSTDATMRGSILSTHDDGSAAVVVVAGSVTVGAAATSSIMVQTGTPTAGTALTPAAIGALVTNVSADLGAYGTATVTDFGTPERIWWANAQTICARYRVAAPTPGSTALEAVIDVQAWASGRALVEVTVENCKMTTASPVKPAAASYSAAVVSVNGATIATINGNGSPEGAHSPFRAVYARSWVGGDPGLRVTQSHTDLQAHPLLFKIPEASTFNMAGYAADAYTPWTTGRHRPTYMGAGGDHASIGPLPQWESRFLQSGDARAAQATEVNALACLGWNINYRDSATGLVPTFADIGTRAQTGRPFGQAWPNQGNVSEAMTWEVAHSPAAGLMAFLVRPSPVFIELAQKVAVFNGTMSGGNDSPFLWSAGVMGHWYQTRGKAWGIRSLAHAAFLTPGALPWREACAAAIKRNADLLDTFRTDPKNKLGLVWNYSPTSIDDHASNSPHFQIAAWQHHFLAAEMHKAASAGLLSGADQTVVSSVADWLVEQPVRWINERPDGGWRYVPYSTAVSPSKSMTDQPATWGVEMASFMVDAVPSPTGVWMAFYNNVGNNYATFQAESAAGSAYSSQFLTALVAAVERNVPGAAQAWQTMTAGVSNYVTWRQGFGTDPRWGSAPRAGVFLATGSTLGSLVGTLWTPGRESAEAKVNKASFDLVPKNTWVQVAGTAPSNLQAMVEAVIPGWSAYTPNIRWNDWWGSWSCLAPTPDGKQAWFFAGGHSNGTNNGVYRIDFDRFRWAIAGLPDDPATWSDTYKASASGSSTGNPDMTPFIDAKRAAGTLQSINDVGIDQTRLDGYVSATARHTYQAFVFVPEKNWLVMTCRRMWRFDVATGLWTQRRHIFDDTTANYLDGEGTMSVVDEVAGTILTRSNGSTHGGNGRGVRYNYRTEAWTGGSTTGFGLPWQRMSQFYVRNGRIVYFIRTPKGSEPAGGGAQGGWWGIYNLDTGVFTQSGSDPTPNAFQYADGLSAESFRRTSTYYDGQGGVYIPPINRIWFHTLDPAYVSRLFQIDMTTSPPTISLAPTDGDDPVNAPETFATQVFVDGLNAVVWFPTGTQNARIYKF